MILKTEVRCAFEYENKRILEEYLSHPPVAGDLVVIQKAHYTVEARGHLFEQVDDRLEQFIAIVLAKFER